MTDKIPPRPEMAEWPRNDEAAWSDYRNELRVHEHAVAKVAVEALKPLLDACVADCGDPCAEPNIGDDGTVGWGRDGDMALTFKIMRDAKEALRQIEESGWRSET